MPPLSFKILRFNFFVNSIIPFITTPEAIIRYGWTVLQVAAFTDFLTRWNLDMINYVGALTNDSRSVETIHLDYQSGYTLIQNGRGQIKGNSTITLSIDEKAMCNIRTGDTRHTSSGIPKTSPGLACIGRQSLSIQFVANNPASLFKRAKGDGIAAIGLKMAITAAGAPAPLPEAYVRQEDETSSEFEMLFTLPQVGQTAYIIGFYINSKGEAGADGIPCVVTII